MRLTRWVLVMMLVCQAIFGITQPYGNEWIDPAKTYFKFTVSENGIYQINRSTLIAGGFPVATTPASRIQLFRQGKEIAIDVDTESDGTVSAIRFYGQRNDGSGDEELYVQTNAQVNPDYNLFTDEAAYFLTYYLNNQNGQRFDSYTEANTTGIPVEDYIITSVKEIFHSNYATGRRYGNENAIQSSRYDFGEGWTGPYYTLNQSATYEHTFGNVFKAGPNPSIAIQLVGGNNLTHSVEIAVGPDQGSLRSVTSVNFSGFEGYSFETSLDWDDFGDDGSFVLQLTPRGVGGAADRISVASYSITVSETLDMDNEPEKTFQLEDNFDGKSFIRVANPPTGTKLLDITDISHPIKIGINQSASNFTAVIRNTGSPRTLYAYTTIQNIDEINQLSFENINPSAYNYLIVTNQALRTGGDPVSAYAQFRGSETGGNHSVYIAEIEKLYDQFNFGDPSPLAIRRFADFMLDGGAAEYLFIIGKGVTVDADYYRKDPSTLNYVNHVPTYGIPGSDSPFTAGLNDSSFEPAIPTGRINVTTPDQVTDYLNKVIEKESAPFNQLWKKNTLHLSGGKFLNEQENFRGFIDDFADVVTGDFLGGKNSSLSKKTTDETEFINVTEVINNGVSLVTFFGHSSSYSSDIEIGNVSDPLFAYRNEGRYPIFLVNGCNAGAVYNASDFIGWGDDWILTPDAGAVGFIASAGLAFSNNLKRFSDLFYKHAFAEEVSFGSGIGDIMQLAGAEYIQRYGTSETSIAQVQQFILNGDPAVKIFGAHQPDYEITDEDVTFGSFDGELILAETDSFYVELIVKNFGRTVTDDLAVSVIRTLEDGTVITYDEQLFERVKYQDTLQYVIHRNPALNESGSSRFEIFLDPQNSVDELDESNNDVIVNLDIFSGSTTNLYPVNFGIVPNSSVSLTFQTSNLKSEARNIIIEIDTTASYNSPWKRENVINTDIIDAWNVDFNIPNLQDGTVFYWRTRLQNPTPKESSDWVESSFTYISNSPNGWMQSSFEQLNRNVASGILINSDKTWNFETVSTEVEVTTHGTEAAGKTSEDVDVIINDFDYTTVSNSTFAPCTDNTFNVMVFDRRSTQPYQAIPINGADVLNPLVCGRRPQVVYNLRERDITGIDTSNSNSYIQRLHQLVDNAVEGDQFLLFNMGTVNFSLWDTDVLSKLEEIGIASSDISTLIDGQPVIILAKKGSSPGTATIIRNNGTADPILEQSLNSELTISGSDGVGSIKSLKIGPATAWQSFEQTITTSGADNFSSNIIGVASNAQRVEIENSITAETHDISSIAASEYRYIELDLTVSDETEQTAPQLASWKVLYESSPDGILLDQNEAESVQEGQTITHEFGFYNYSEIPFQEDLEVVYSYFNQNRRSTQQDTLMIPAPAPGDTSLFSFTLETIGLAGSNDLTITVNTNNVPELYTANNILRRTNLVVVERDATNPVLDVTFDGKHIQNGELVSPNPLIRAMLWDDNQYLLKQDTVGMLLFYKPPCDSACEFNRIYFSDPQLNWSPASESSSFMLTYQPTNLVDGWHGLRIQAEDASGNQIGDPYEINFTVDNTPRISALKAFPNPFSSGVRFSFTASGNTPPDYILIQIYSLRGEILQNITIDDPDVLKIGPIVTPFIWDGNDANGKPLSNGLYFYKVFIGMNGDPDAFGYFENAIGQLVLLR